MYTLKEAFTDFIFHCKHEKGLSEQTIKFYTIDLTQFESFIDTVRNYSEVQSINKEDLRQYIQTLSNLKPKSIKRKIATLKSLFNNLEYEDRIIANPFRKMRIKIKEPKILPKTLTKKEVCAVFKEVYNSIQNKINQSQHAHHVLKRDIAVFELLFATGVRVSELSNLKSHNINLKLGYIKVCGKGNKERIIQICNREVLTALTSYSELLFGNRSQQHEFFFINRLGKKLSDQSIRSIVKKYSMRANIKMHVTPHVFRHTFATLLLENDVDIKYIQAFLGHSSISTTQLYTHVSSTKQRKIVKLQHPRKDFSMCD
jgi:integrase/recombinase XerD